MSENSHGALLQMHHDQLSFAETFSTTTVRYISWK